MKTLSLVWIFILLSSCLQPTDIGDSQRGGDVNRDGFIDEIDYIGASQCLAGQLVGTKQCQLANLDDDPEITARDLELLIDAFRKRPSTNIATDVNNDGKINEDDFALVSRCAAEYRSSSSISTECEVADINDDNIIDFDNDLQLVKDASTPSTPNLVGDLNGDDRVDTTDYAFFVEVMGCKPSENPICQNADLVADDSVGVGDFTVFYQAYLKFQESTL